MRRWVGVVAGLALAGVALHASAQSLETLAATTDHPWLIEGVARDADGGLVLSSIRWGVLRRVAPDGALTPFGPEGRQAMFGLVADPARGALWVASSPSNIDGQADRPGELIRLDPRTGEATATFTAEGPDHAFGDVAVGPDGAVFVGDTKAQQVLVLAPGAARLQVLAALPSTGSPQGMAVSADGRWLIFSDYRTGLHRLDLSQGYGRRDYAADAFTPLAAPEGVELRGIDGLARHGDTIIAIQNGTRTPRVLRLTLSEDWSAVAAGEALLEGAPLEEPTTGFVEGDSLVFVSRSQWTDFGPDGRPKTPAPAPAVISRLPL
jgi:sugar lactone lactonase YvrE